MISLGTYALPKNQDPITFESMAEVLKKLGPVPPKIDLEFSVKDEKRQKKFTGCKVQVCPYLPDTVKDKDGNEVELIGIMTNKIDWDKFGIFGAENAPQKMVFLTGEIVKKATK